MGILENSIDPLDLSGRRSIGQATDLQLQLNDLAQALDEEFFNQLRADEAPVRATRNFAIDRLKNLSQTGLPLDSNVLFQQGEARNQVARNAAASGKFFSGQRLKTEQDVLGNIASQGTNRSLNRLLRLAGFTTSDLGTQNQLTSGALNRSVNNRLFRGDIEAAGIIGQANANRDLIDNGAQAGLASSRF